MLNTAGLNAYLVVQLGSRSMEHEERRKLYLELPNQTCRTNVELLKQKKIFQTEHTWVYL